MISPILNKLRLIAEECEELLKAGDTAKGFNCEPVTICVTGLEYSGSTVDLNLHVQRGFPKNWNICCLATHDLLTKEEIVKKVIDSLIEARFSLK